MRPQTGAGMTLRSAATGAALAEENAGLAATAVSAGDDVSKPCRGPATGGGSSASGGSSARDAQGDPGGGQAHKYSVLLPTYNEAENIALVVWLLVRSFEEWCADRRRPCRSPGRRHWVPPPASGRAQLDGAWSDTAVPGGVL